MLNIWQDKWKHNPKTTTPNIQLPNQPGQEDEKQNGGGLLQLVSFGEPDWYFSDGCKGAKVDLEYISDPEIDRMLRNQAVAWNVVSVVVSPFAALYNGIKNISSA